ncbi:MAG: hypothetical protein EXS43_10465 [Opitutus sp.]|nr:hypothetical protein [Opitutus sp.]
MPDRCGHCGAGGAAAGCLRTRLAPTRRGAGAGGVRTAGGRAGVVGLGDGRGAGLGAAHAGGAALPAADLPEPGAEFCHLPRRVGICAGAAWPATRVPRARVGCPAAQQGSDP